jgi:hypothetical protein
LVIKLNREQFPKKVERFFFFSIENIDAFRKNLTKLIPLISTAEFVKDAKAQLEEFKLNNPNNENLPLRFLHIAFSATGVKKVSQCWSIQINITNYISSGSRLVTAKIRLLEVARKTMRPKFSTRIHQDGFRLSRGDKLTV